MKNYFYRAFASTKAMVKLIIDRNISNNTIMMKEYLTISTNKMASRKISQTKPVKYARVQ